MNNNTGPNPSQHRSHRPAAQRSHTAGSRTTHHGGEQPAGNDAAHNEQHKWFIASTTILLAGRRQRFTFDQPHELLHPGVDTAIRNRPS